MNLKGKRIAILGPKARTPADGAPAASEAPGPGPREMVTLQV